MMSPSSLDETRRHYLATLLVRHGTLRLPIRSLEQTLPFQSIYQPLTLRTVSFETTPQEEAVMTARNGAEALSQSALQRMVVLGRPGMGKTTLLKALLQQAIQAAQTDPTAALPLFLSLPDLARSGLTLSSYLPGLLKELGVDATYAEVLLQAVRTGQAFLCLDSLDEVVPAQRPDMIALINREAVHCGGTWIIGSRFTEYKGGQFVHSQFAEWELQPLDDTMRLELAGHLLPLLSDLWQKTPAPTAQDLIHALNRDARIAAWGENPLLLNLTAMVYVQAGMLPSSRTALYRDVVHILLSARTPDPQEQAALRTLLAEVALQLYQTKGRNFSVAELFEILNASAPARSFQEQVVLVERILGSGLLDVVSHQTYGFQHQMFQEYLAAVALADQVCSQDAAERRGAWEFLWRKHTYSRWSEVLRLCVGVLVQEHGEQGSQMAAQWLRRLADEHNTSTRDVGNFCLELAVGSLREFPLTLSQMELVQATRVLILVWAEMLIQLHIKVRPYDSLPDNERLWRLIEDVKMLDCHLVLPAIIWLEGVRDAGYQGRDPHQVAKYARYILVALVGMMPARVLESAFPDSQRISLSASMLPDTLRRSASMATLVHLLEDTQEHWRIRAGAAQLLGEWTEQTPIGALSAMAADAACSYQIRVAAVEALGKQEERIPIELLVSLLQDPDEHIRASSVSALANTGERLPVEPFLAALNDSEEVMRAVINGINKLKGLLPSEPILPALQHVHGDVRCAAIKLLGRDIPLDLLLAALHDPDLQVRHAAVETAAELGDRVPLASLLEILHDESIFDHTIVHAVVAVLLQSGRTVPVAMLIALAQEHKMPERALEIAQKLQIALPVEILLAGLCQPGYSSSDTAASLLGELGENAPVQTLLDIVCHPATDVEMTRIAAIKALLQIAPFVPTEPIFSVLQDVENTSQLYRYLVCLLVRCGAPVKVEVLLKALPINRLGNHKEPDFIALALTNLGEQAPIEDLLHILSDKTIGHYRLDQGVSGVLKQVYEAITVQTLQATSRHRIEDEYMALKVLGAMGKNAPIDFIKNILNDEHRHRWLRSEARDTLYKAGIHLPLHYFLAEGGLYKGLIDEVALASIRELGPRAPMQELLEVLMSHHGRRIAVHHTIIEETVIEALRDLVPYLSLEPVVALLDHNDCLVRQAAVRILGAFADRAPINRLIAMLQNPEEVSKVRVAIVEALAELHVYTPAEAFMPLLRDHDTHVSSRAADSLQQWGKNIPLEALLALVNDAEYDFRSYAIRALGCLQERVPLDFLLSLLNSESQSDSECALLALSHMGTYAPLDILIPQLSHHKFGRARYEVLCALIMMGEDLPLDQLFLLLDAEDEDVRNDIICPLGNFAEAAPVQFVALARDDKRPFVCQALMRALAKLGQDAPVELALAALEDPSTDVRWQARRTLVKLQVDPALIPLEPLLAALQEKYNDEDMHEAELALLATCGARVPVAPLLALLGDTHPDICANAAHALYQTHPEVFGEIAQQAEAILRGEPTDGVFASRVQSRMADRVCRIERATPQVLALMADLLDWPYWEVRLKAARALSIVHRNIPDRAIRRLLELRHDPESQAVREAADEALAEILSREHGMEDE